VKTFIINFNRLTLPKTMAEWLAARGCDVMFIDNASDYPPLLEYYHNCPFDVVRMDRNYGHTVIWDCNVLDQLDIHGRYIVTDPDLDLSGVPDDFISVLNRGLDTHRDVDKCGLSLRIDDLPDTSEGRYIREHEAKYWKRQNSSGFYDADVDTTLALYREGVDWYSHRAVRAPFPYTARHVSWYYDDLSQLTPDELNYFKTADANFASGKKRMNV